jgi:hypothetical protein
LSLVWARILDWWINVERKCFILVYSVHINLNIPPCTETRFRRKLRFVCGDVNIHADDIMQTIPLS